MDEFYEDCMVHFDYQLEFEGISSILEQMKLDALKWRVGAMLNKIIEEYEERRALVEGDVN